MNPLIQMLVNQLTSAPGFKETLDRINTFITTVDSRLASIQAKQDEILAATVSKNGRE